MLHTGRAGDRGIHYADIVENDKALLLLCLICELQLSRKLEGMPFTYGQGKSGCEQRHGDGDEVHFEGRWEEDGLE